MITTMNSKNTQIITEGGTTYIIADNKILCLNMSIGEKVQLFADRIYRAHLIGDDIAWHSRRPHITDVDEKGLMTAYNSGWNYVFAISKTQPEMWGRFFIRVSYENYTNNDPNISSPTYEPQTPYDFNWRWVFDDEENTRNISSGYKSCARPDHNAIDIAENPIPMKDLEIKSPTVGNIKFIVRDGHDDYGLGNAIVLETNNIDPITNKKIRVLFAHLRDDPNDYFEIGDNVWAGELLGHVGNTGVSVGDGGGFHLHLAMFNDGSNWANASNTINPQRFFPRMEFTGEVLMIMY